MANIKISELEEATQINDNDLIPFVDVANNETKKIKAQYVGTGQSGAEIPISDTEPLDPEEDDLWIDTSEPEEIQEAIKNEYSESTSDTYSCDYVNDTFELKPTILYKDNTGTTGTVSLSDSSANYSFIEIFYTSAYNYNSTKVYDPNGKSAYLLCGWFNGNTAGNVKIANVQINGNQIAKVNHTALNYSTSNTVCIDEDQIAIKCVIGYK